uniref:Uncharacterized protein n=2 Tax=Lotharella oceanica TaxID=641309 RepID=A0A7S2TZJ5_9EUKA|mmetsp:Transcript_35158/g.65127  ORF Transcript_35158/g.65127 Transcript_35158/m.65127 type:complete len:114 (+) Transcript_35158:58-399(+)
MMILPKDVLLHTAVLDSADSQYFYAELPQLSSPSPSSSPSSSSSLPLRLIAFGGRDVQSVPQNLMQEMIACGVGLDLADFRNGPRVLLSRQAEEEAVASLRKGLKDLLLLLQQ